MSKNTPVFPTETRPWLFLGLTLGVTWLLGFLGVLLQGTVPRAPVLALAYGGALSPLVFSVGLAHGHHDRGYRHDLWRRLVDTRRVGLGWVLVILFFFPAKAVLAALIDVLQGGVGILRDAAARLADRPVLIVPTLLFWLLFGPLPEEPGWRGYAADELQSRHSALSASLIVGVVWMPWHLPLFFIEGTWQASHLGFGTQLFWGWAMAVVLESILYTWITNNTERSILAAILFHFAANGFGELSALSQRGEIYAQLLSIPAVLIVVAVWGPRPLTRAE